MFVANVTAITLLGITLSVGLINANPPKLIFKIKHHERTKLEWLRPPRKKEKNDKYYKNFKKQHKKRIYISGDQ